MGLVQCSLVLLKPVLEKELSVKLRTVDWNLSAYKIRLKIKKKKKTTTRQKQHDYQYIVHSFSFKNNPNFHLPN